MAGDTYWSTIAQICPVLAIPMAIEVRRLPRRWPRIRPWLRATESVAIVLAAFMICAVFELALSLLGSESDWPEARAFIPVALFYVLFALTVPFALDVAVRGNLELARWLSRLSLLPRVAKQAVGRARPAQRSAERVAIETLDLIERTERIVVPTEARLLEAATERDELPVEVDVQEVRTQMASLTEFIEKTSAIRAELAQHLADLAEVLDGSVDGAEELANITVRSWLTLDANDRLAALRERVKLAQEARRRAEM